MKVNAMHSNPAAATRISSSPIILALKAGAVAALAAGLLAGRVPEALIIVGVIVAASIVSWHRVQLTPARIRQQHRFTVVSRCGDGFVTIDSSGARHVAHRAVLGSPTS
ncbi:MAG: hypothetical protein QOE09_1897 [Ilumatobacteraceae bacterium]|jgi:hypothetical protein